MKRNPVLIAPSVLAADFSRLPEALKAIDESGAPWVHLDVMDGQFVPPITFGSQLVSSLRPLSRGVFDVHLMVKNPENQVGPFIKAGADYVTFHIEASLHAHALVEEIHKAGAKAGLSLVPSTGLSSLEEMLPFVDLILVMTVNPGYGGQKFIEPCLNKVRRLRELREERGYHYLISVDGGINGETAPLVREAGVDVMVTGSAFFAAPDKKALVRSLEGL